MDSMYLPKQVMRHLLKYLDTGVTITVREDEVDGKMILRWIADHKIVLWSKKK